MQVSKLAGYEVTDENAESDSSEDSIDQHSSDSDQNGAQNYRHYDSVYES